MPTQFISTCYDTFLSLKFLLLFSLFIYFYGKNVRLTCLSPTRIPQSWYFLFAANIFFVVINFEHLSSSFLVTFCHGMLGWLMGLSCHTKLYQLTHENAIYWVIPSYFYPTMTVNLVCGSATQNCIGWIIYNSSFVTSISVFIEEKIEKRMQLKKKIIYLHSQSGII